MVEFKVWVLSGIVAILLGVLGWIIRVAAKAIINRLDEMIKQNEAFGRTLVWQNGEISSLKSRVGVNERRINDHAKRLRDVEIKQSKVS